MPNAREYKAQLYACLHAYLQSMGFEEWSDWVEHAPATPSDEAALTKALATVSGELVRKGKPK